MKVKHTLEKPMTSGNAPTTISPTVALDAQQTSSIAMFFNATKIMWNLSSSCMFLLKLWMISYWMLTKNTSTKPGMTPWTGKVLFTVCLQGPKQDSSQCEASCVCWMMLELFPCLSQWYCGFLKHVRYAFVYLFVPSLDLRHSTSVHCNNNTYWRWEMRI